MRVISSIISLFLVFFFQVNGFSYTRIYLISEAEINNENVKVSDICKMEGDDIDIISNIIISPELYRDSIIDNKELYDFLNPTIGKNISIFGSGIRIRINAVKKESNISKVILIEKGDMIELAIRKNGIVIEMKGKAMNSGSEKDEIDFKLPTGKVVKGKIKSDKKADILL